MISPKISGETMPPILKPVVTKPNTLPKEPGGVASRTIMSRGGMITPEKKPAIDITRTSATAPRSISPIITVNTAIAASPSAVTVPWRLMRLTTKPPASTPIADSSRLPVSAALAVAIGVPYSAPSATTE